MSGRWQGSNRRDRLPADWERRRLRVLQRDHYCCQARDSIGNKCGKPANQVDHIKRGDDHSTANLQALCEWHHRQKSAAEGAAASRAARKQPPAYYEDHPGLLK